MVALAVVAVVAVGAVVLATRGDDDGSGIGSGTGDGGSDGGGWVDPNRSNPHRLATDGEVVCAAGIGSGLYCLDAVGGEERFAAEIGNVMGSPTIVDDHVLVADESGIYAYTLDGEEAWTAGPRPRSQELAPRHLPVAGDTVAVVHDGSAGGELVGFDVVTGDERWRLYDDAGEGEPSVSNFSDVLTDGERLYVTTETTPAFDPGDPAPLGPAMTLVAVDPATGDELWQWVISPGSTGFPVATEVAVIADGSAVAFVVQSGGMAGNVVVLDGATGELRWEAPLAADDSSIAHVDGVTVVADGTDMRGYDDSGAELWAVPMPDQLGVGLGTLVVRDGRLFSSSYDVYEIDPTDGTSNLVREGVSSADVAITADHLVMASMSGLEAIPLPTPP